MTGPESESKPPPLSDQHRKSSVSGRAQLPEGETEFVADGQTYVGNFVKVAVNVATRPGEPGNALHALLSGWFGPSAGHPGTSHQVTIETFAGKLVMRPLTAPTTEIGDALVIPLFPTPSPAAPSITPTGQRTKPRRSPSIE